MKLLRMWALPLVGILAVLFFSGLAGSIVFGPSLLLLVVWLGYALFQTRSRVGIAVTGGVIVVLAVSIVWLSRNPDLVESFFVGRISSEILASTGGAGWQEKTVGSFRLRYREHSPGVAEVESALPGAQARVAGFFNKVPSETVVVIYPNLASLERAVKSDLPEWGIGGAFGDMMAVTSPEIWSAEVLAGSAVEQIVTHEFTHVVVNQLTDRKAPKWLNEGIATYVAGQFSPSARAQVGKQSAEGGLYSLAEVSTFFRHPAAQPSKNAGLMYADAASVVAYVVENYGVERLVKVLTEIKGGNTADQALQSVFGVNQTALEAAWRSSLR